MTGYVNRIVAECVSYNFLLSLEKENKLKSTNLIIIFYFSYIYLFKLAFHNFVFIFLCLQCVMKLKGSFMFLSDNQNPKQNLSQNTAHTQRYSVCTVANLQSCKVFHLHHPSKYMCTVSRKRFLEVYFFVSSQVLYHHDKELKKTIKYVFK